MIFFSSLTLKSLIPASTSVAEVYKLHATVPLSFSLFCSFSLSVRKTEIKIRSDISVSWIPFFVYFSSFVLCYSYISIVSHFSHEHNFSSEIRVSLIIFMNCFFLDG